MSTRRAKGPCSAGDCDRLAVARGLCRPHYMAQYRAANREKAAAYHAQWRGLNGESAARREAAWRRANRHRAWLKKYVERAARYGIDPVVEPFTAADLVARWGDRCFHCGGEFQELDHFPIPVKMGGHHTLENARPSCAACNRPGINQYSKNIF